MQKFGLELASGVAIALALLGYAYLPPIHSDVTRSATDISPVDHPAADLRIAWVPTSEFSRQAEDEAEQRLNKMMQETRVGDMTYPGETPLSDILDQLGTHLSQSVGQPILFRPDLVALDDESISSLHEVMIRDIDIQADLMTAGSAMDYILSQTDPQLAWIARDELLLITTKAFAEAEENLLLRSYDISGLCHRSRRSDTTRKSSGGLGGGGGLFQIGDSVDRDVVPVPQITQTFLFESPQTLMQAVFNLTSPPCRWFEYDGEGGRIVVAGNRMLVRQTRTGHLLIAKIMAQFEAAAAGN